MELTNRDPAILDLAAGHEKQMLLQKDFCGVDEVYAVLLKRSQTFGFVPFEHLRGSL
nr:hypothetical protein [Pseudotabrizicola formosa]